MRLNLRYASPQRQQARRLRRAGFSREVIAADMGLSISQIDRLLYSRRVPKGMRGKPLRVIQANFPELFN